MSDASEPLSANAGVRTGLLFPRLAKLYRPGEHLTYPVLRLVFGIIILSHGLPKMFGFPHGDIARPFAGTVRMIGETMHFPAPLFFAYLVTGLETVGAIMLAIGLLTRVIAAMLAFEFAMICMALYPAWAWGVHGMEYPFLMACLALYMVFRGGGAYALDNRFRSV